MRFYGLVAAALAFGATGLMSPQLVQAGDAAHEVHAEKQLRYYPRYGGFYRTYGQRDPFAYEPSTHGYYPYYNSGDWKPARLVPLNRAHFRKPDYYPGWGASKKHWADYEWHAEHHGRHPFWDF